MPNHVTNIIYANESVLKSIINQDGNIDFNLVKPFTGEFRWNGIRYDAETAAKLVTGNATISNPLIASMEMTNRSRVDITNMDDEGFEQFVQMLKNKRSCGFLHPMDFARSEWGTKWNAYSQELRIDDGFIKFKTAWSCPVKLLCSLSSNSGAELIVEFADEDIGSNCGALIILGGEVVLYDCAGKWSEMTETEKTRWSDFARAVTGINEHEED